MPQRRIVSIILAGILGALIPGTVARISVAQVSGEDDLGLSTANLPFTMRRIELPRIPARSVSVTEFGAEGNGENASVLLRVEGEKSEGISITATDLSHVATPLEFDKGAKTTAVIRR